MPAGVGIWIVRHSPLSSWTGRPRWPARSVAVANRRRSSAMTCCRLFGQDVAHAGQERRVPDRRQRLGPLSGMAGLQLSTIGRIWVSTEARRVDRGCSCCAFRRRARCEPCDSHSSLDRRVWTPPELQAFSEFHLFCLRRSRYRWTGCRRQRSIHVVKGPGSREELVRRGW